MSTSKKNARKPILEDLTPEHGFVELTAIESENVTGGGLLSSPLGSGFAAEGSSQFHNYKSIGTVTGETL